MSAVREKARQLAFDRATQLLAEKGLHDFTWQVARGAEGKRGEHRIGYALGVLNALETRRLLDNE